MESTLNLKRIKEKNSDSVLLLVGDGSLKNDIKTLSENLSISDSVLFYGYSNDIASLLTAMDVFLMPSISEGLGIACIEAQASGLPTILSDNVPNEAKVLDTCCFLSLNKSADFWADIALKSTQQISGRMYAADLLKDAGYDISATASQIADIYNSNV